MDKESINKTFIQWVHSNTNITLKAKDGTTGKAKYCFDWLKNYPPRIDTSSEPFWLEIYPPLPLPNR